MRALAVLCKLLKLSEMEATGVEPASVLQTRKLLTLRTDKKDKTDTSPITAYKMHTKSPGGLPASILRGFQQAAIKVTCPLGLVRVSESTRV